MSSIRFARSCPTCGKMLEIGVDRVGREVECYHCGIRFAAHLPQIDAQVDREMEAKIERLLNAADRHVARFSYALVRSESEDDW